MKKKKRQEYYCKNCGEIHYKWQGRCKACGSWNSLVERTETDFITKTPENTPVKLEQIETTKEYRIKFPDNELNRVLGGGLVPGSIVLLGGEPGIGKSTLLLQLALNANARVLYVSGEEALKQIKLRSERLTKTNDELFILAETNLETILANVLQLLPDIVIIDSIQTITSNTLESPVGSITQMREITAKIMNLAKKEYISFFLVGHITKEGTIAGPKLLEHMVDVVLYFEGDRNLYYRILRSVKNRFGSVPELGIYEMRSEGLLPVENPSALFLSHSSEQYAGVSTTATMQGMRAFLVEIQALVSQTMFPSPQRTTTGFPQKRLNMLIAVLEKHCNIFFADKDIFLNIAGGFNITEPATDLAVAAALYSSYKNIKIPKTWAFAGEVSLTGEIRPVSNINNRLVEADRLGFTHFISAKQNTKSSVNINWIQLPNILSVIELLDNIQ